MKAFPKARSTHLIVRELDQETLVYDTKSHRATCLNKLAGEVWRLCDGTRSAGKIADDCQIEIVDAEIVSRTLGKLSDANLLETPFRLSSGATRRAVVAQLAGVAGLAAAVTAITVPAASQGASCLPRGSPCDEDDECCSGRCRRRRFQRRCR